MIVIAMNIIFDFDDILLFVEEMLWAVSDVLSEERDKALQLQARIVELQGKIDAYKQHG